jgi:hypothetical protein
VFSFHLCGLSEIFRLSEEMYLATRIIGNIMYFITYRLEQSDKIQVPNYDWWMTADLILWKKKRHKRSCKAGWLSTGKQICKQARLALTGLFCCGINYRTQGWSCGTQLQTYRLWIVVGRERKGSDGACLPRVHIPVGTKFMAPMQIGKGCPDYVSRATLANTFVSSVN